MKRRVPSFLAGVLTTLLAVAIATTALAASGAISYNGATVTVGGEAQAAGDRLSAALRALGAVVETTDDGLVITGSKVLRGGTVDAANDHRIAMMAAVLATRCDRPTTILGAECVEKSYPRFFEDLTALGGSYEREV